MAAIRGDFLDHLIILIYCNAIDFDPYIASLFFVLSNVLVEIWEFRRNLQAHIMLPDKSIQIMSKDEFKFLTQLLKNWSAGW